MYINDLGIKEINEYYAQHGGRRTAAIKNFANYMENVKTGRISTANALITAKTNAAATDGKTQAQTGTAANTSRQSAAENQTGTRQAEGNSADTSGNTNYCCDKCRLTNQLMLQMLSNNLYTQSALGYSPVGSGALAAYQSLSKFFGNGVFS